MCLYRIYQVSDWLDALHFYIFAVMLEGDANNIPYPVLKNAIKCGAQSASNIAVQIYEQLKYRHWRTRSYNQPTGLPDELMADVDRYT